MQYEGIILLQLYVTEFIQLKLFRMGGMRCKVLNSQFFISPGSLSYLPFIYFLKIFFILKVTQRERETEIFYLQMTAMACSQELNLGLPHA